MQKIKFGNMLQLTSGILVHGCNSLGVMGSGIAKQIRDKWPNVYEDYYNQHRSEGLKLGDVVFTSIDVDAGLFVASAITQELFGTDGRQYSSYEAIFTSMKRIAQESKDVGLPVHYPMIGAGLGGGDWTVIQSVIDAAFTEVFPNGDESRTLWILDAPVKRR